MLIGMNNYVVAYADHCVQAATKATKRLQYRINQV